MRAHPVLARAQRLLAGVVLVLSGGYMIVYLYRWEWNRAIISGVFFVAAEVALATSMILRRLQGLEDQAATPPTPSPLVLERLRSTPVDRPNPFAWLEPRGDQLGVFIPVLLGAGAILSTLAYVVERVAEATAVPVVDRRLATRLATLRPPEGGLRGNRSTPPTSAATRRPPRGRGLGALAATALALAAIAVVGWLGVQALLEATQSRPDPADRPTRTTIELSVAQRGPTHAPEAAAEALWVGCRSTLGSLPVAVEVTPLGGDRVALVLEPGVGRLGVRRLTGCLSDLRVDLVKASVRDIDTVG
jgi:hypothetical protein